MDVVVLTEKGTQDFLSESNYNLLTKPDLETLAKSRLEFFDWNEDVKQPPINDPMEF